MRKPMSLKQITSNLAPPTSFQYEEEHHSRLIYGLTADSRKIKKGFLFAAFLSSEHIGDAVNRGAVAVLTSPSIKNLPLAANAIDAVAHIKSENPRKLFAEMSAKFYPTQYEDIVLPKVVAITGTNGKTSVAIFMSHIWNRLGFRAASIGTLGLLGENFKLTSSLTTPSADIVHRMLSGLARRSYKRVALEASSHGLAQYRLDGTKLAAAIFTRLGEDHFDYHQTRADYLNAKLRLVREVLPQEGVFVCDDDAPGAKQALDAARDRGQTIIRVGERKSSEICIKNCRANENGQLIELIYQAREYKIQFPLIGRFQAVNALLAAAAIIGTEPNLDPRDVFSKLKSIPPVQGRLEKIAEHKGAKIFIDYAHTPDALEAALNALRPSLVEGARLHLVFGAGGERDQSKRPLMAKVAEKFADEIIVTDDNPRHEDAASIRATLLESCARAKEIGDRGEAIKTAIENLKQNDLLLIAGKGHETYQIRGSKHIEFSDLKIVLELVS